MITRLRRRPQPSLCVAGTHDGTHAAHWMKPGETCQAAQIRELNIRIDLLQDSLAGLYRAMTAMTEHAGMDAEPFRREAQAAGLPAGAIEASAAGQPV